MYVGGLPRIPNQDSVNAEMRELFAGWNIQAVSKIISPSAAARQRPGSHYYCFVDFPSAAEAQDALRRANGRNTPYGGHYKVYVAASRPNKVIMEQNLGGVLDGMDRQKPMRERNLDGDWRR